MYDSERDSFMIALKALGYSMNTKNLDEIQQAYEWLIRLRDSMDPIYAGDDVIAKIRSLVIILRSREPIPGMMPWSSPRTVMK